MSILKNKFRTELMPVHTIFGSIDSDGNIRIKKPELVGSYNQEENHREEQKDSKAITNLVSKLIQAAAHNDFELILKEAVAAAFEDSDDVILLDSETPPSFEA